MRQKLFLPLLALFFGFPALAQAHTGHDHTFSLMHGFGHPISGVDHMLAMVAVGLWAWQLGGRAIWLVPTSFVSVMAVGGALGWNGVSLPWVEQGILASIFVLGLFITFALRVPVWAGAILVGVFALFHGFAHGCEMPAQASSLGYAVGFMGATALLHGVGLLVGLASAQGLKPVLVRYAGVAILVGGCYVGLA